MPSVTGGIPPHAGQPMITRGASLDAAAGAVILIHGRGGSAQDIMGLWSLVGQPSLIALAPQASRSTWYPYSFLSPFEMNQPGLDSGLSMLAALVEDLERVGIPSERIGILGFSQGGCLALEFSARNARHWGAVIGFSSGLIGPPGTEFRYDGSYHGAPIFMGCSDIDPHIPIERFSETTAALSAMGATLDARIYPKMGHTINDDEIQAVKALIAAIPPSDSAPVFGT